MDSNRAKLVAELEWIVGQACYNGNIQNWGPGGSYEGEGRYFRYPLSYVLQGNTQKWRYEAAPLPPQVLETGHYAFGANRLHIIRGLDKAVQHLERTRGLKV